MKHRQPTPKPMEPTLYRPQGNYIKRSDLIYLLTDLIDPADVATYINGVKSAINLAKRIEAVDAVEVVRCRDCVYKELPHCCPCQLQGFRITDDWFCPMGVRGETHGQ